jgi:CheY-like chemotaxis protein
LARAGVENVEDKPRSEQERAPGRSPGSARVLYIEDSEASIEVVRLILSQRPVELIPAMNAAEGIEKARSLRPALILLDLGLPDRQGIEVLEDLHSDPATEAIPVVVLTADATKEQEARLLVAGAIAYLTKPMDHELFLALVDGILSREAEVP